MKNKIFKLSILAAVLLPFTSQSAFALSTDERLKRLERMADNPISLQLSQRISEQQREIQKLQDQMDRILRDNRQLTQQGNKRYSETDQRLNDLETKAKSSAQSGSPSMDANATSDTASSVSTTEQSSSVAKEIKIHPATPAESDQYQAAFSLMSASKYDESVKAFEAFVARNPESSLASNASYWAGEGYLINKKYQQALAAFERVLEDYPGSLKVPDSMLRSADSLMSLKRATEARALYQKVLDNYPGTPVAKSAEKRMK